MMRNEGSSKWKSRKLDDSSILLAAAPAGPTGLDNLFDIVAPPPVPGWPLAPGWFVVGGVALVLAVWTAWHTWDRWRAAAYRRAARAEWQQLKTRAADHAQREAALRQLPELIKRTALAAFPREEETLKAVATTTGGRYSHANDRAGLAEIYAQLDALRTREVQTVSHRPRRELFHWPLGVGMLLSLAYHLVWAVRTGLRREPVLPTTAAAPVREDFLASHPDADLRRHVEALQGFILGRATSWNRAELAKALRQTRQHQVRRRTHAEATRLPALNPPWVGMLLVALFLGFDGRLAEAGTAVASPTYVGGQVCIACHPQQAELWKGSDHALAMQPANSTTVLGNFDDATFEKDGVTSTFFRRGDEYFVRTDGPDGQLHEYKIAYTFGVDPLQQYLVAFPNGRYQALSIAWDSRPAAAGGRRWFHLYPHEKIDHRDVLHWTRPLQNWNFMCADCHSTNLEKNYRLTEDRYETTWSDISVACEACHGPGSRHVEWARDAQQGRTSPDSTLGLSVLLRDGSSGAWTFPPGAAIARRNTPLASRTEVETCGRCHARRAQVWGEYQPGQPLGQAYRVALLDEGLYHADGQIRDEVYEYGSFLQSLMYRAGVTCSNCHDPHSGRLRAEGNGLCAQCHLPATYDGPQHHFHKPDTVAAQCVSCHMIERVYMVIDGRRDHSFRVPRPDLSMKINTPNACTDCHAGRTAQWAADAVTQWYGPQRKGGWHYGEAIAAGRQARTDAERELVRTVEEGRLPGIVRATAMSLLQRYLGPQSLRVLEPSLGDSDPLFRRAAAGTFAVVEPRARVSIGLPLLRDPIRTVRLEAVSSLVEVPRNVYTPDQLAALDEVIAEYRQAQAYNADRAEAHLNLGALDARLGKPEAAEAEYRIAIRLQPAFIPPYINLADLYRQQGREDQVSQTLREAVQVDPANGAAHHALGLSLVRQQRLREALPELATAAQLQPDTPRYAYVYGVALHESGQVQRALQVLAEAQQRHPADRDILVALVEYHRQAGDRQAAIAWARKLVAVSPGDAQARRLLESLGGQP